MSDRASRAGSVACGLAAEIVRRFGAVRLRVNGCSMLPELAPGDLLIVQRRGAAEFTAGQIAVFIRQHRLFAHRVVERCSDGTEHLLLTRGDAIAENDPPVSGEELLGEVVAIERGAKQRPLRPPAGWNLLLARLGSRWDAALRALAKWHGLRRRARQGVRRFFSALAAGRQGESIGEKVSP